MVAITPSLLTRQRRLYESWDILVEVSDKSQACHRPLANALRKVSQMCSTHSQGTPHYGRWVLCSTTRAEQSLVSHRTNGPWDLHRARDGKKRMQYGRQQLKYATCSMLSATAFPTPASNTPPPIALAPFLGTISLKSAATFTIHPSFAGTKVGDGRGR